MSKAGKPIRSAARWHTATGLREPEKVCRYMPSAVAEGRTVAMGTAARSWRLNIASRLQWKWCPPAKPTPFPPPVLLCHQQGGHSFCFADPRLHPLMGRISALWKGGGVNRNSSNLSRSNRYFFPHLVEGISPAITFLLIAVLVSAVPGSCSRT